MRGTINHRDSTRAGSPRRSRTNSSVLLAIVLAVAVLFTACGSDTASDAADAVDDTIDAATDAAGDVEVDERSAALADVLRQNGATSLATMVTAVDFDDLTDATEYTFFAPSDDAFLDMTADESADLLANPDEVVSILRNHVVGEPMNAAEIAGRDSVESEAGNQLAVVADGETVMVGGVTVTQTDLQVGGGVVHVVDGLITP